MRKTIILVMLAFLAACNSDDTLFTPQFVNDSSGGLILTFQELATSDPSLVSLLFKVDRKLLGDSIAPVLDITDGTTSFTLLENGEDISEFEGDTKPLLRDPNEFQLHTYLLLDLSGSIVESEGTLQALKDATVNFINTVMPGGGSDDQDQFELAIGWFDGQPGVTNLVPFTNDKEKLIEAVLGIDASLVQDESTNLNGAIVRVAEDMEFYLREKNITSRRNGQNNKLFHSGAVFIFTDGTDLAARATDARALNAINTAKARSGINFYSIGLGFEVDLTSLKAYGESGFFFANNEQSLSATFRTLGLEISKELRSYYYVEYCSPKRKGIHELELQLIHNNQFGTMIVNFSADGFTGDGCN